MRIVVTGGAGFIGSNLLLLLTPRYPEHEFINVDRLTYAANLMSVQPLEALPNYRFRRVDIGDSAQVDALFAECMPDVVIHLAAESHVDRSIVSPGEFVRTNIQGTFHLLEASRRIWGRDGHGLFHHVSTDEVFGSLGVTGAFTEETPYDPSSPYSASKAASDHLVRAYHRTYGLPVRITNCSNNYGPRQFPEKLIPLMILNALEGKPLPVYGQGLNVRDWLYVEDHCEAIWLAITRGSDGRSYNIGGHGERRNIDVVYDLCRVLGEETREPVERYTDLIQFVPDRPGHDLRYAIDPTRATTELGWRPSHSFEQGLRDTVRWYLANPEWVDMVRSGEYLRWMEAQYGQTQGGDA